MNRSFFLCLAACRMRSNACDTLSRSCARRVLCWSAFPLVPALGSTGSAAGDPALFVGMAPAEGPGYVGTAVLEESGFGATAAAPVVRRVLQSLADPTQAPTVGPGGV